MKIKGNLLSLRCVEIITFLICIVWIAVGCESIGHLRQAQRAFNDAATIEGRIGYEELLADKKADHLIEAVDQRNQARTLYAASLAHLDMISQKEASSLKKNRLYGTVLTLKALCYWKLKEYEQALAVKKEADRLDDEQLIPRDRQIFRLLTALIAIDETLPIVEGMSGKETAIKQRGFDRVQRILLGDEGGNCAAVCTINSVLNDPSLDKGMRLYARQLKLMALKRYFDAYRVLKVACPPADHPQWKIAEETLANLQKAGEVLSDASGAGIVHAWITKIGCGIALPVE